MGYSPSIVAASLSNEELKKSVDELVSHVDKKMKEIVESTNDAVNKMEERLKSLSSIKIDSSKTSDSKTAKESKAQDEVTRSIKNSTAARKEYTATYDQQTKAISTAAQSAETFIQKEREQLRMRQHEIEAFKNRWGNIEIRPIVRDDGTFNRALDNIRGKIDEVRRKFQEVPPTSPIGRQLSQELQQLRSEYSSLIESRKAFAKQGELGKLNAEYDQIKLRLRELATWYKQTATSEQALKAAMDSGSASVDKYADSAKRAEKAMKDAFARAIVIPTKDIDLAMAKFESLKAMLADHRFLGALSPAQIERARKEVDRLAERLEKPSIAKDFGTMTSYSERALENFRAIRDLIRDTARNLREADWTRKQYFTTTSAITGATFSRQIYQENDARAQGLTIEEQILRVLREKDAAEKAHVATQRQITEEVSKQYDIESKKKTYQRPVTEIGTGFNRMAANVLGISEQDIIGTSQKIEVMTKKLQQLEGVYVKLNSMERASGFGQELVTRIQTLSRSISILRNKMNTPVSLKRVLGLDESTLDNITYKIQQLSRYRNSIDISNPNNARTKKELDDIAIAIDNLKKKQQEIIGANKSVIESNNALGRSWNYMKNRLAFYFTVGASTQFVKNLIEVRSQYEMNERALGILIDSAERGTQIFQELSNMALVSPYTLIELSSAAKQLTAYDVAARDVVDTTRRLADMAAAVGIPIERLTYALGQIRAYGYLNSRDNRMFANAGIPLVKQLSDYYTELEGKLVSTADVYDRIKKKAVDYNTVMQVINKMTDEGGKFFDFQAKMADTLKVRLANLTLAWNNMLNEIGKDTQGVLVTGINLMKELFLHWKEFNSALNSLLTLGSIVVAARMTNFALFKMGIMLNGLVRPMTLAQVAGKAFANVLRTLWGVLQSVFSKAGLIAMFSYWAFEAGSAAIKAIRGVNEAQEELNKSIREGAKDNAQNISKFLKQYEELRKSLYTTEKVSIGNVTNPENGKTATMYAENVVPQDIEKGEAKKAWEAIREQIELTTKNADVYIGRLLSIENISERVRQGFNVLDDLEVVNNAIKNLGDDTIKISQDWSAWWNAWQLPDGLIENLKDLDKAEKWLIENFGSVESARKRNVKLYNEYERGELEQFRKDLNETTESILNFINLKGWSGDTTKISETFSQILNKITLDNNLSPELALKMRVEAARAEYGALKNALDKHLADERAAYAAARDEREKADILARINTYETERRFLAINTAESKAYWSDFTKWMSSEHKSEMSAMFKNMSAEQIRTLDFSKGEYYNWVTSLTKKYADEHGMAYESVFRQLKNYVTSANQWSIFIPLTISTEDGKSVYDTLKEADQAADAAWQKIQRLKERQSQLNKIPAAELTEEQQKEATTILEELTSAWADYNNAIEKGGKSKKEDAAGRKAQKQAESELQKALKEELQLIDKVRSAYKSLTDADMRPAKAAQKAVDGLREAQNSLNKVLQKYGVRLDLSKFVGISNPQAVKDMLMKQVDTLMNVSAAKPEELRELKVKIRDIDLDVEKFNQKTIKESLNNELGKLKDEYELAVSLDADPELGYAFADMMGLNIDALPRTVQEYADKATKYLNKYLADNDTGIQLPHVDLTNDDLAAFEEMVKQEKMSKGVYDMILKVVKEIREARKKDIDEHIKSWDKLINKYSELEGKIKSIQNTAAMERKDLIGKFGSDEYKSRAISIATKLGATDDPEERQNLINQLSELADEVSAKNPTAAKINVAINKKEAQEIAGKQFEEFQKSAEWITATGDLSTMTQGALNGLIASLEKYKKTASNLSPKNIKQINSALKSLHKQVRQGNPFSALADAISDARERAAQFAPEIADTWTQMAELEDKVNDGTATDEQKQKLEELKKTWDELLEKQKEAGKVSATTVVSSINSAISTARQAASAFNEMAEALGGKGMTDAAKTIKKISDILEKGGQGAAAGAQLGGGWGAIIGAGAGLLQGVITNYYDQWTGNASITNAVEEAVKKQNEYNAAIKEMGYIAEDAIGSTVVGYKGSVKYLKELQLAELKRQLALEQQRDSKNRDDEKIASLRGQIIDLEREISKATLETINDLLGISSHADFFESMISEMISTFKKGEDAMQVFEDKWSDMIDSMIGKQILGQVLGQWIKQLEAGAQSIVEEQTKNLSQKVADKQKEIEQMQTMDAGDWLTSISLRDGKKYVDAMKRFAPDIDFADFALTLQSRPDDAWNTGIPQKVYDAYIAMLKSDIAGLNSEISERSIDATDALIDYYTMKGEEFKEKYGEKLFEKMSEYFSFGQDSDKALSALQQGIQGITENTAGALEATTNGISQQCYLQSDLLTQIRDAILGFNLDIQMGVLSEILLQLRSSFEIQQAIHGMLNGWSSNSGRSVRVEMI